MLCNASFFAEAEGWTRVLQSIIRYAIIDHMVSFLFTFCFEQKVQTCRKISGKLSTLSLSSIMRVLYESQLVLTYKITAFNIPNQELLMHSLISYLVMDRQVFIFINFLDKQYTYVSFFSIP